MTSHFEQDTYLARVDRAEKPARAMYEEWLQKVWKGDTRELRRGRYFQQQRDLQTAFDSSPFLTDVRRSLPDWSMEYQQVTGVPLFTGAPPTIDLKLKPWESFLSRTWRHNVHNNGNWPNTPPDGWLTPDCWFEELWDIVRTRLVVRYLDGVQFLANRLANLGKQHTLLVELKTHAQEWGYYAMHVTVPQTFDVQTLNYEGVETRKSMVEMQLTTELQEAIGLLTHGYFETRREEEAPQDQKWQWDYRSAEFTPYYLGHLLHYLEGMIMRVRDEVPKGDDA